MRISGSRICSWERLIFRQENYSEAVTELAKARELSGGSSEAIGMTGYAWALEGDFPKARAVLKELKALASQRHIPSTHLALLCYTLDEKTRPSPGSRRLTTTVMCDCVARKLTLDGT
jgi:hypothetical protein